MESRREVGQRVYREVMQKEPPAQASVFRSNELDQLFADVWTRGGISRKDRRWITLAIMACRQASAPLREHVYGALASGDISVDEMMEATNHLAIYGGMARGPLFDDTLWDVAAELGLAPSGSIDLSPRTWASDSERLALADEEFCGVMNLEPSQMPPRNEMWTELTGPHVYAETWSRGVMSRRERRWITMTCAAMTGSPNPTALHWNAALGSGDLTQDELNEYAFQFHAYAGGPQSFALPKH